MKKLLLICTLLMSLPSQATLISLNFDKAVYQQGDVVTGQLIASDLSYTLGGFAGTIEFDHNLLPLTGWSSGNGFDDGFGDNFYADDSAAGMLFLENFADPLADSLVIEANQGNSFILASFTFQADNLGMHTVNYMSGFEIWDFSDTLLDTFSQQSASFNVTSVPEPMTGLLFASCLLLLRRKLT